eukprot:gene34442-biopygen15544
MAKIHDIGQVYLDLRQPAGTLAIQPAQTAAKAKAPDNLPVTVLDNDGRPLDVRARLLFSGISVDEGTGDVLLRVLIDNKERRLLPGMFARARIARAQYPHALAVPQQAVVRSGNQAEVWVLSGKNTVRAVPVELAELIDDQYRVISGLKTGDKVIVEGLDLNQEQEMPQFFIRRPVFAWVIALFIILLGLLALPNLPIARYPSVAPPQVTITATYPGATPQSMNDSVLGLIERELASVKNLLYFESSSDTSGSASITVTFKPGTNPELAQVDVQNRLKTIEARLPQSVRQNGLIVESAASGFLMVVDLKSDNGRYDSTALSDYMARNIMEELRRIDGVGRVQMFGAEQAMRIWVDPEKLLAYKLSMADVNAAISKQNLQIAPGRLGDEPARAGQRVTVPLSAQGQLETPQQFAAIVLRAKPDGSKLVLGDVAKVELGAQSYGFSTRENGKVATAAAIQLAPGANAVRTSENVKARLEQLARSMPAGMSYSVPFDTAPFAKISIEKVVHTLIEAMVLVFLVMFLFLQNLRYTLIPAIVAPIALLGTFSVMALTGYSINVLTMFGMVLAIGIIVDDAIV